MIGPGSLAVDNQSFRKVELQCFKDPCKSDIRICYVFERLVRLFEEDKFHGFYQNPLSTVSQFYTMASYPKVSSADNQLVCVGDSVSVSEYATSCTSIRRQIKRNYVEEIDSEKLLGCILVEQEKQSNNKSERIHFQFVVQNPKYDQEKEDDLELSQTLNPNNKRKYYYDNSD
jgi:hypothetical protein